MSHPDFDDPVQEAEFYASGSVLPTFSAPAPRSSTLLTASTITIVEPKTLEDRVISRLDTTEAQEAFLATLPKNQP